MCVFSVQSPQLTYDNVNLYKCRLNGDIAAGGMYVDLNGMLDSASIYPINSPMLPFWIICTLSFANVENVVNPPQMPVVSNKQKVLSVLLCLLNNANIIPKTKHPNEFSSHPRNDQFVAAKHLLRYLKNNSKGSLTYSPNKKLSFFINSDWAGDINDRKSYSGYVLNFGGSPIAWESKKTKCGFSKLYGGGVYSYVSRCLRSSISKKSFERNGIW